MLYLCGANSNFMFKNKFKLRNVIVVIICLAATIIISACNFETRNESQYRTVQLSLEGKKYDELLLAAVLKNFQSSWFSGTTTDGSHWTFLIPDSIAAISRFFFIQNRNDSLRSENEWNVHQITFRTIINGDTLTGCGFNFDKNETIIELRGTFDTTTRRDGARQTVVTDYFTMSSSPNTFLRELMQTRYFGFFYDSNNPDKSYEEFLLKYADLIKQNPNSLYYISTLAGRAFFFNSQEDIERLFNLFSAEMQNSVWGEMIRRSFSPFILDGLNDIVLPNALTNKYEKIILDPATYTLLCFSASWCPPCIRAIPMLKEIHEATKGRLNLVYLTIDDNTTIDNWRELMKEKNIEWRSLRFTDSDLRNNWQILGVPNYILIAPNGYAREIWLRNEDDVQELFSILNR